MSNIVLFFYSNVSIGCIIYQLSFYMLQLGQGVLITLRLLDSKLGLLLLNS